MYSLGIDIGLPRSSLKLSLIDKNTQILQSHHYQPHQGTIRAAVLQDAMGEITAKVLEPGAR